MILDPCIRESNPLAFAQLVSKRVASVLTRGKFDAVVVFGGDMAYAILRQLGQPDLWPLGEVVEGVPVSAIGRDSIGMKGGEASYMISKAGGFGPVDVLPKIHKTLAGG